MPQVSLAFSEKNSKMALSLSVGALLAMNSAKASCLQDSSLAWMEEYFIIHWMRSEACPSVSVPKWGMVIGIVLFSRKGMRMAVNGDDKKCF